jgi:hypothetical protein
VILGFDVVGRGFVLVLVVVEGVGPFFEFGVADGWPDAVSALEKPDLTLFTSKFRWKE